ncbi:MAG TPA: hypothetical protein VF132_10795 [Rudaea sp.]
MGAKEIKARIKDVAERAEDGVEAAAKTLGNGVDAIDEQHSELNDVLRDLGRRVRESTKTLTDEAARQARLRPLAMFGFAVLVGIIAVRVLRR